MIKGQSWCQSSCINSKNLLGKKFEPKMIILVFLPLGVIPQGTPGYLVRKNFEKKKLEKYSSMFVSYSRIKNMGPQLLSAHIKGQKWVVEPILEDFGIFGQNC